MSPPGRPTWEMLEGWLGEGAQELIQGILEEAESGTPATRGLGPPGGELGRRSVGGRNLSTTMGHSTGLIREQCPVW